MRLLLSCVVWFVLFFFLLFCLFCVLFLVLVGLLVLVVGCFFFGCGVDEILQGFVVVLFLGATKADFDIFVAIHSSSA